MWHLENPAENRQSPARCPGPERRTENGAKLCDIQDGGHNTGDAIADWPDEQSFIAFFARQSDFSMSGWDENEPVFHSTDSWYCNNQRLTRKILARYAHGQ